MTILEETAHLFEKRCGDAIRDIRIERSVLGLFFTGVKLSNGAGGICYTPVKEIPGAVCCPSSAGRIFAPEKLRGMGAKDAIAALPSSEPLKVAVAVATLNALSSLYLFGEQGEAYNIKTGMDALDALDLQRERTVSVVGAIIPALRLLKAGNSTWWVIEEDPRTLKGDEISHYVPFSRSEKQITESDLLVITGVTLLNRTLEWILDRARPDAEIAVMGPTASMLPDVLFERNVSLIGGVRVKNPDALLDLLAMGGSGYHFFDSLADRILIMNRRRKGPSCPRDTLSSISSQPMDE